MNDDAETVLGKLYRHYKYAGAPKESTYDFNGGFSYHAESHAFGVGAGVGWAAAATGQTRFIGAIVGAAFGLNRGAQLSSPRIMEDIKQEPHYALFGLVVGALLALPLSTSNFLPSVF